MKSTDPVGIRMLHFEVQMHAAEFVKYECMHAAEFVKYECMHAAKFVNSTHTPQSDKDKWHDSSGEPVSSKVLNMHVSTTGWLI